jgi:hypothetical protein
VGASAFFNTPSFGTAPAVINSFSSAGGTPILRAPNGDLLQDPIIRKRPNFVGPDGISTTFFGTPVAVGPNPSARKFFGTSASAPNVAAVAILMKQANASLTSSEIYRILERTADDMDDPFTEEFDVGFDFKTGYGYVNASTALDAVCPVLIQCELKPTRRRNLLRSVDNDGDDIEHRRLLELERYTVDYTVLSGCDLSLMIQSVELSVCGGATVLGTEQGRSIGYLNDNTCNISDNEEDVVAMGTDLTLTVTATFTTTGKTYTCTSTAPDIDTVRKLESETTVALTYCISTCAFHYVHSRPVEEEPTAIRILRPGADSILIFMVNVISFSSRAKSSSRVWAWMCRFVPKCDVTCLTFPVWRSFLVQIFLKSGVRESTI